MREIKIRYTFKRLSDDHIYQLIYDIAGVEENSGQLTSMLRNELWKLHARDLFIGLLDKDGKEIFEGDIVRILYTDWPSQPPEKNGRYSMSLEEYKKSISVVRVVKYLAPEYFACNPDTDACSSLLPGKHGEIEVIGNKYHESPELLQENS